MFSKQALRWGGILTITVLFCFQAFAKEAEVKKSLCEGDIELEILSLMKAKRDVMSDALSGFNGLSLRQCMTWIDENVDRLPETKSPCMKSLLEMHPTAAAQVRMENSDITPKRYKTFEQAHKKIRKDIIEMLRLKAKAVCR